MTEELSTNESEIAKIQSSNALKLNALKEKANDLALQCQNINIKDDVSEAIAVQIISKTKEYIKNIDTLREELKQPFFQTGKKIDALAKELSTPLLTSVEFGNKKVLDYTLAKKAAEKKEKDRIANLKMELDFFLNNTKKEIDKADSEATLAIIWKERVKGFPAEYLELGKELITAVITDIKGYGASRRQIILNPVKAVEIKAIQEEKSIAIATKIDMMEVASIGKSIAEPTRIKQVWVFEVIDKTKLPLAWLSIDEDAIKKSMKEAVSNEQLKPGDDKTVNGVRFYQKDELKNIR